MPSLTPICAKCRVAMRCVKNDRPVRDPEAGGFPSTYWFGDEWECPDCGARIVTGFGHPIEAERVAPETAAKALEFRYELPPGKASRSPNVPAAVRRIGQMIAWLKKDSGPLGARADFEPELYEGLHCLLRDLGAEPEPTETRGEEAVSP